MRIRLASLAVAALLPWTARAAGCAYTAGAATVNVGGRPFAAQPSADGCWLFVSLTGVQNSTPGIAVLKNDGGAFRLAHVAKVAGQPGGLALSHTGRLLAAAAQDRTLLIDVARLEADASDVVRAEIPGGKGAIYAAFSRDDRLLFVSEERGFALAVVDVARAAVTGQIPQGAGPVGLALSPDGGALFATSEIATDSRFPKRCAPQAGRAGKDQAVGELFIIDVARAASTPEKSVVAAVNAGCGPVRVALSPDGKTAWVTARGDDALLSFRTSSLRGVQPEAMGVSHPVGVAPVGVAVRPDGAQVWAANSDRFSAAGQGTLSELPTDGGLGRTVASGGFPRDMAFLPDGKTLVVSVFRSGAVQFIPTDGP